MRFRVASAGVTALLLLVDVGAAQAAPAAEKRRPKSGQKAALHFGAQASYGEDSEPGLGARAMWDLPGRPLTLIGSFDYFFPPKTEGVVSVERRYWELNGNVAYGFGGRLGPYIGTGLNMARGSAELGFLGSPGGSTSETKLGLNVLAGLKPRRLGSRLHFFGEARYEIKGGEQFVASVGFLF